MGRVETQNKINPRHHFGLWSMCFSYGLCEPDNRDVLRITALGQNFLSYEEGQAVQNIDYSEGLLALLTIVSEHGPGKRAELLTHFREFLLDNSRMQAQSVVSFAWYERSANLVDRGLIRRDGITYAIESKGLSYLELVSNSVQPLIPNESKTANDLRKLLDRQNKEVHENILQALRKIDPYVLEQVVKTLLEAMNYENVEVTKPSNDGGVDVVADITVGITYVREVVQVKRHQNNIQRKVLDELRGSLHRFKAYRGTIITTGQFSKGAQQAAFEPGAAPITLIDGERLVDLLIENEIGARKETINILKFAPDDFNLADELSEQNGS